MKLSKNLLVGALLLIMPLVAVSATLAEATSFSNAIAGGQLSGSLRLRWENVDQEGRSKVANAVTLRSLIAYETKPLHGVSINAQLYGLSPLTDSYNDAKKGAPHPSRTIYPVVADPEDYSFHQIYLQWENANNKLKLGRQNMVLDNWRYVGDVRFRQNWAVFNGLSYVNTSLPKTTVSLAHYEQLKQVTTKIQDANIEIANIQHTLIPGTSLSAYGYFIDWNGAALKGSSTKTFGLRLDGKHKLNKQWKALYTAEYAKQGDYKDGSNLIDNDYYRIGGGFAYNNWFLRIDQEKLSGNSDGKSFQTQLGTNHLFQGWADVFLKTPDSGIKDTMLIAGGKLMGAKLKAEYHFIQSDRNFAKSSGGTGNQLGKELNLGLYYPFTKQLTGAFEYAKFTAGDQVAGIARKPTIRKVWVTAAYKF